MIQEWYSGLNVDLIIIPISKRFINKMLIGAVLSLCCSPMHQQRINTIFRLNLS